MSKVVSLVLLVCFVLVSLANVKPQILPQIVAGRNAAAGQFPYQVSVQFKGSHICCGSIIGRQYILTAAHCVGDLDKKGNLKVYAAKDIAVRAGSTLYHSGGVLVKVQDFVVNENYGNSLHDLAVIRLKTPLTYSNTIKAIPLTTTEVPPGAPVIISGWVFLNNNGTVVPKLQWNTSWALSRSQCAKAIGEPTNGILCLGHKVNNGVCFGNSGGSATYNGKLVGVANFVVNTCGGKNPDGYASVFEHLNWIRQNSHF